MLTSDVEIQHQMLEIVLMGFGLALVQYFLILMFRNGNIYPLVLEICILHFDFDFIGNVS